MGASGSRDAGAAGGGAGRGAASAAGRGSAGPAPSVLRSGAATNTALVASGGRASAVAEAATAAAPLSARGHHHHAHHHQPGTGAASAHIRLDRLSADNRYPLFVRYKVPKPSSSSSGQPPAPPPRHMEVLLFQDAQAAPAAADAAGAAPSSPTMVRRVRLNRSEGEFYAVVMVPRGTHHYRFVADGVEIHDAAQPAQRLANGRVANYAVVGDEAADAAATAAAETGSATAALVHDDAGWGQTIPVFEDGRKFPPLLPPHLRYTPLNAPPTHHLVAADGTVAPAPADTADQLPVPLSVTINHLYFQRREDHTLVGITTRYGSKYTSVAYYTRPDATANAAPAGAIPVGAIRAH